MQPMHLALLSTLFLLREVESGSANVLAWTFDHRDKEVSWTLPGSKTDPLALGTTRTWGCLCELQDFACPYHLATEHYQWLLNHPTLKSDGDSPLFPTIQGSHSPKTKVIATFEQLATLLNQPLTSPDGLRLFGGHTARVTGAQTFALAGLEVNKIRILARHSGDTILRYTPCRPRHRSISLIEVSTFDGPRSKGCRRDAAQNATYRSRASDGKAADCNAKPKPGYDRHRGWVHAAGSASLSAKPGFVRGPPHSE